MAKDKDAKQFVPTMTKDEIAVRTAEATVRLTEAKAESEAVKAKSAQLEYDRLCGELIYLNTAMAEFNSKLAPVMAMFKNLPTNLTAALKLTPKQHQIILDECAKISAELAKIDFEFDTAFEVDERIKQKRAKKTPRPRG